MKLLAILRIKDEKLVIRECLTKLSELVDEIVILDNGSTDGTLDIYSEFNKIVKLIKTFGYHEGRDKCLLLKEAQKRKPDWIIWIDGDEIFEKNLTRKEIEKYMNSKHNRIKFRMCNFWLNKKNCRIDGNYYLYTLHPQRSMWRNTGVEYFKNAKMHNGDIRGVEGREYISPFRIKHFGYVDKDKIQRKFDTYKLEDKEDKRNYDELINPEYHGVIFRFKEFNNPAINLLYIISYKYICNLLWILLKIKRKILN